MGCSSRSLSGRFFDLKERPGRCTGCPRVFFTQPPKFLTEMIRAWAVHKSGRTVLDLNVYCISSCDNAVGLILIHGQSNGIGLPCCRIAHNCFPPVYRVFACGNCISQPDCRCKQQNHSCKTNVLPDTSACLRAKFLFHKTLSAFPESKMRKAALPRCGKDCLVRRVKREY